MGVCGILQKWPTALQMLQWLRPNSPFSLEYHFFYWNSPTGRLNLQAMQFTRIYRDIEELHQRYFNAKWFTCVLSHIIATISTFGSLICTGVRSLGIMEVREVPTADLPCEPPEEQAWWEGGCAFWTGLLWRANWSLVSLTLTQWEFWDFCQAFKAVCHWKYLMWSHG